MENEPSAPQPYQDGALLRSDVQRAWKQLAGIPLLLNVFVFPGFLGFEQFLTYNLAQ